MNWREKILNGMKLIKEGCEEDPADDCSRCPFWMFCDLAPSLYFENEIAKFEDSHDTY